MLDLLDRVLNFELTIVELVCVAVLLSVPYLALGIIWASTHAAHFDQLQGAHLAVSLIGTIVLWPALWFFGACVN